MKFTKTSSKLIFLFIKKKPVKLLFLNNFQMRAYLWTILNIIMYILRALSSLRGVRGAPEVPPLCRETQSLGQHMLELSCENATVGTNGLTLIVFTQRYIPVD